MRKLLAISALMLLLPAVAGAQLGSVPHTFTGGTTIFSSDVNENFSTVYNNALNRTGGTMTGQLTSQNIMPDSTGVRDIGSSALKYDELFVTSAQIGTTVFLANSTVSLGSGLNSTVSYSATNGLVLKAGTASSKDFQLVTPASVEIMSVATGTRNVTWSSPTTTISDAAATLNITGGGVTTTIQPGFMGTSTATNFVLLANSATIATVCNGGGMTLGAPTGGCKGAGILNVSVDIKKNDTAYTNPKWALQKYFTGSVDATGPHAAPKWYQGLRPIEAHREFVARNHDLPLMLQEKDGGLFARGDMMLASVEEAYLYIYQLHDRISQLEKEVKELKHGRPHRVP